MLNTDISIQVFFDTPKARHAKRIAADNDERGTWLWCIDDADRYLENLLFEDVLRIWFWLAPKEKRKFPYDWKTRDKEW